MKRFVVLLGYRRDIRGDPIGGPNLMRTAILCLALLLAACGNSSQNTLQPSASTGSGSSVQTCVDRTPPAPPTETTAGTSKPDVKVPDGPPPCKLVIQDIHVGTGPAAQRGASVTVHYVGVSWSTRRQFDASWDNGQPLQLPLDGVIKGWQQGIPGMKEGGRRRLIIPPDLAYGASGRPGIAPNETLVFVIDLIKAR